MPEIHDVSSYKDIDTTKPFKGFIGGWILLSDGRIHGSSYVTDIEERQDWERITTSPIIGGLLVENGVVETQNAIYRLMKKNVLSQMVEELIHELSEKEG